MLSVAGVVEAPVDAGVEAGGVAGGVAAAVAGVAIVIGTPVVSTTVGAFAVGSVTAAGPPAGGATSSYESETTGTCVRTGFFALR
jgi:hypothetical protein